MEKNNKNIEQSYQLIEKHNFVTLISHSDGDLLVSHIPIMLNRNEGQYGSLSGHLAKVNPHLKMLDTGKEALCIFQGPHAYISPTWYKTKPNVPTWNYAIVHVYGTLQRVSDVQLSDDLCEMIKYYDPVLLEAQKNILPDEYKEKLIAHIVGFKMEISKIEMRFKLGQNRALEDKEGMLAGLRNQNTTESSALFDFINAL